MVTKWTPYELSLVAIPADATVGVGRSAEPPKPEVTTHVKESIMTTEVDVKPDAPVFDANAERTKIRTEEARRRSMIDAIADRHDVAELAKQAVSEGWDVATMNEKALEVVGERNNAARAKSKHDGNVDLSPKDEKRFSMLRLMDAIAHPNDRTSQQRAGFELEVSAEAVRAFGSDFKCRGQFVPEILLGGRRDLSAGTATDGAELVASNLLAGSYIEVLRNTMVTAKAGITMLSGLVGNVDIPRQTAGAASTWISAEDGDATEGEAQFDQVSLTPKDLACYTEVTRRLLMQSTPAIEGIVMRDLAIAQALGIDLAVLYGSASSGQPRGIKNQTGVNTLDLAAAAPTYAEIIQIVKKVLEDNALVGNCSWLISPAGWEDLKTTPKQGSGVEGNFILGESGLIAGYNWQVSNQVTAEEYFFGDFSQVLLGEWGGLEINVDPYTSSLKGRIRYITFKTVDVAVRQPTAFCYSHDGI
jgi:HK97 family phage major capsid protein